MRSGYLVVSHLRAPVVPIVLLSLLFCSLSMHIDVKYRHCLNRNAVYLQEAETESSKQFKQERSGGDYGEGTREMQTKNYISKKENERKRREMFDDALEKFAKKDIEGVRCFSLHSSC